MQSDDLFEFGGDAAPAVAREAVKALPSKFEYHWLYEMDQLDVIIVDSDGEPRDANVGDVEIAEDVLSENDVDFDEVELEGGLFAQMNTRRIEIRF